MTTKKPSAHQLQQLEDYTAELSDALREVLRLKLAIDQLPHGEEVLGLFDSVLTAYEPTVALKVATQNAYAVVSCAAETPDWMYD